MNILKRVVFLYKERIKNVLAFFVLAPILILGLFIGNNFVAGSSFFYANYGGINDIVISFILGAFFLLGFSVLCSILMYAIKPYFIDAKIEGFKEKGYYLYGAEIFGYFLFIWLGFLLINYLVEGGFPELLFFFYGLLLLAIMYAPQAMVFNNSRFWHSFFDSIDFIIENPKYFAISFISGVLLVLIGVVLDYFALQINYLLSYFVALLYFGLVIPFYIILNSYLYILKNPLIKRKEEKQVYDF